MVLESSLTAASVKDEQFDNLIDKVINN